MSPQFRLVWLVLDPYTGGRVPLGALVEADGAVQFVPAAARQRAGLTSTQEVLADLILEDLRGATSLADLPIGAGPQVVAGDTSAVPASMTSPARWVALSVLGQVEAA